MLFGKKKKNNNNGTDQDLDRKRSGESSAAVKELPAEFKGVKSKKGKDGSSATSSAIDTLKEQGDRVAETKKSERIALDLEEAGLVKKPSGPVGPEEEAAQTIEEEVPVKEGYTSEDEMLQVLSEQVGMPFVRVDDYEIDQELLDSIPSQVSQMYKVFPLERREDGSLLVAVVDPLNVHILDDLSLLLGTKVSGAIANEGDILDLIEEFYGQSDETVDKMLETLQEEDVATLEIDEDNFDDLERLANEAPIIKLVNLILLQAIKDRASDLHVEPYQNSFRIRYRVDGTLHETVPPPKHLQLAIISRLKVMANMNIAERRLPQDGRIKLSMSDREIDLRVSALPTVNGESIVMRILDKTMMMIGLEQIGLMPEDQESFERIIRKPHGIVLVTGPTGSGKTTTLYSALMKIFSPMLKMITTEDPVEYQLDGVVQVNINERVGLTFASCLRSILRQDPDIIMVGEIRDLPTAQIAIEAALTGHLVLSTLHTNDAPGAVTRLIDMDVEPFLVTSTVESVLAQRLVRTICTGCKETYTPEVELLQDLNIDPEDAKNVTFHRGKGCVDCNYTGYRGRIGIFEHLVMNDTLKEMVLNREPTSVIRNEARRHGMKTMREDGWEKVIRGITTVEEIVRETQ